jgi:type IV pilus assembly protein PilW
MNQSQMFAAPQRQRGLTLIELLVSITIGLIILTAIGTAYVNSSNLIRQRENQSDLNEPARIALRMLQFNVSKAGYVDHFDNYRFVNASGTVVVRPQGASVFAAGAANDPEIIRLTNLFQKVPGAALLSTPLSEFFPGVLPVFGCDGAMNGTPNGIATGVLPAVVTCGAANATQHSLQIAYQAVSNVGGSVAPSVLLPGNPLMAATGEGTDCAQQAPPGAAGTPAGSFVINRFFVQTNASDGVNELYCSGSGNFLRQPIARGVEEFMVRYQLAQPGVAPVPGAPAAPAAGGAQGLYVNATGVATVALNPIGWAGVTAVEVCFISATPITNRGAMGSALLQATRPTCARAADGQFSPDVARVAGDARLWKRYTSVISVRNAVFSSTN